MSLIEVLASGGFHNGEELGQLLGISRSAICKRVKNLNDLGLRIDAVKGRGYCLASPLQPLNRSVVDANVSTVARDLLSELNIFSVISSTNDHLMQSATARGAVCLAEMQTAGRGRRGRAWVSPYAANICLSLSWRFSSLSAVQGLSLAVGVVLVELLDSLGVAGLSLKWPNDLLLEGKKVGGILIELSADAVGECFVVLGAGLNVDMKAGGQEVDSKLDQPWNDLRSGGLSCSRSELAGMVIDKLLLLLASYDKKTFSHFRSRWEKFNFHKNMQVVLTSGSSVVQGQVLGVSAEGALRLLVDGEELAFSGGEVSLRGADAFVG